MSLTEVLLLCMFILMLSIVILMFPGKKRKSDSNTNTLLYSPDIVAGYERWLNATIAMYMVRFIEEKLGEEHVRDDELNIGSNFVLTGIDYVCKNVAESIPDFYHNYMVIFYGRKKLPNYIYEKVRAIFIEYVDSERKKRLTGNSLMDKTKNNKSSELG